MSRALNVVAGAALWAAAAPLSACAPEEEGPLDCAGLPGDNEAPVVDIIQPGETATFEPGEAIHFIVRLSDDRDAPGDLQVVWEDSIDGVIDTPPPREEDGVIEWDYAGLSEGRHALVITATDSGGCSGADDRAIQVCSGDDCLE